MFTINILKLLLSNRCFHVCSPVPSYNWTRRGAILPRQAVMMAYNRVLLLSNVQVEDQGEYVCRATNERASIVNSVVLSIQGTLQLLICICNM